MVTDYLGSLSIYAKAVGPGTQPGLYQGFYTHQVQLDFPMSALRNGSLTALISRYPTLEKLSSFLSTVDLFNLAITNRTHYSCILLSRNTFDILRRDCLCDGSGLAKRQNFVGLYSLERRPYIYGDRRKIWQDEPIEIRLYGTKCDNARALPCRRCSINVCEVSLKRHSPY